MRERSEDIPLFAGYFLERIRRRLGLAAVRMEPDTLDALERYPWPGNVSELDNVLSRAVLQAAAGVRRNAPVLLTTDSLHLEPATSTDERATPAVLSSVATKPLREAVDDFRRASILRAVRVCDGNWSAAARELGMDRSNLHHLARRLGLDVVK